MKIIPIALEAHYQLGTTTISHGIRIERRDAQVFAYTSAQFPALIDSVLYEASGLSISDLVTSLDMSVGNLELSTLHDRTIFTEAEVFGGVWDNASFEIFEYNRKGQADGRNPLVAGNFGKIVIHEGKVVVELRDLMQYVQQPLGEVSSKNCRNRLGDDRCQVNLALFTVTGSLTSVVSPQVFRDSSRVEAADWFGEGVLTFTSGDCAGFSQKVKVYGSDGTFTLSLPMFSRVRVGDAYSVVAGCRRRHDRTLTNPSGVSDCLDKFNNVPRFRGEPHRPGVDEITAEPAPVV